MLKFVIINIVIAFLIIYLSNEILNYMKNTWTQPKVMDLFQLSKQKYEVIHKNINNIPDNVNNSNTNNYNITNNMKQELQEFIKNNIDRNSYKDKPAN